MEVLRTAHRTRSGVALDVLSLLFLCRVLGQLGVYLGVLPFLPPMNEWQSGLLPYPILLASQFVILALMIWIRRCLTSKGTLVIGDTARYLGPMLKALAIVYGAVMVARLVVWAWAHSNGVVFLGGWIPPVFHVVLASYLFILATTLTPHDTSSTPTK